MYLITTIPDPPATPAVFTPDAPPPPPVLAVPVVAGAGFGEQGFVPPFPPPPKPPATPDPGVGVLTVAVAPPPAPPAKYLTEQESSPLEPK